MLGRQSNDAGSRRATLALLFLGACFGSGVAEGQVRVSSAILSVIESVEAPAPESGLLFKQDLLEGDRVHADQVIGRVDPRELSLVAIQTERDLQIARRESQSDLSVRLAEAEARVALAELQRATSVNSDLPNTVSDKEIDRLRLAVDRTELQIENARFERELLALRIGRIEADLSLARHRVERLAIRSPIAGVVSEVHKRAGEWVDRGEPVARIVRVDRLRAEGYVHVEQALEGLVGRPVEVRVAVSASDPIVATGKVVFVSPEAEPVNSQVRFWAEVDNREMKLRPGLTAEVTILGPSEASR